MDILFTIVASILLLVGFLVICRSSGDDEEDDLVEDLTQDHPNHDNPKNT
jgi:hypothetical protein